MSDRLSIDPAHYSSRAAGLTDRIRSRSPLVHSVTNQVVANMTANALLAIGASPAMVDIVGEAGMFAGIADGLLINLGTPAPEQRDAMREAVEGANAAGTPWVLDPVAIGTLPIRTAMARELLLARPTAIRGNASEILALAGEGSGGRGVDSADSADGAQEAALALAREHGAVVAVSGPIDLITDGVTIVRVANGHELLTKITGGGCALGSVIAAYLGVPGEESTLERVAAAHIAYEIAAERAAARADGPGSFSVFFTDELASLTSASLGDAARVHGHLLTQSEATA